MTGYTLFNRSGCLRGIWAIAGALSRQEFRQFKQFPDWPSLSAALEQVKAVAYYRILLSGLKSLYMLDFEELDEISLEALGKKMADAYKSPHWYSTVLKEKAGFDITCQDSRGEFDRSLFTPVTRMDGYALFGKRGWGDAIIAKHGGDRTSSLEGLVGCLGQDFHEALKDGAAAVKSNLCWGRTLSFDLVGTAAAADALAVCNSDENDEKSAKVLGDYMMNEIAKLCAAHDIPLQIHTGPAGGTDHMVEFGNPLNLNPLILRNPETKFILFHAGGPFVRESAALATQFPNVFLDLCGVLGRDSLRRILDDWLEFVPHTKIMWGTDVNMVEEAYAISRSFREVLFELLEARVKSGYISYSVAEDVAKAILAGNAKRVLRLES